MSKPSIRVVSDATIVSCDGLLAKAASCTGNEDLGSVIALAETLAIETRDLARRLGDCTVLASVTCVIQDQRLKVAYLEEMGKYLL